MPIQVDDRTRELMAYTLLGEAGNQGLTGMTGVPWVMRNRLASGKYGSDLSKIATDPSQFTSWATPHPAGMFPATNSPQFKQALSVVDSVLGDKAPDYTGGADHFYNPVLQKELNKTNPRQYPQIPGWTVGQKPTTQIGAHQFYRLDQPPVAAAGFRSAPAVGDPFSDTEALAPTSTSPSPVAAFRAAPPGGSPYADDEVMPPGPTDASLHVPPATPNVSPWQLFGKTMMEAAAPAAKLTAQQPVDVVSNILGTPGNLVQGFKSGVAGINHLINGTPYEDARAAVPSYGMLDRLMTGRQIADQALQPFGGRYEPTSTVGRAYSAIGPAVGSAIGTGFLPGGSITGPAVAGAAAGGAAGEAVSDLTGSPWLGFGANLLAGSLPGAAGRGARVPLTGETGDLNPAVSLGRAAVNKWDIPLDAGDIVGGSYAKGISKVEGSPNYPAKVGAIQKAVLGKVIGGDAHGRVPDFPDMNFSTSANNRITGVMNGIEGRYTVDTANPQLTQQLLQLRNRAKLEPNSGEIVGNIDNANRVLQGQSNFQLVPGNTYGNLMRDVASNTGDSGTVAQYNRELEGILRQHWEGQLSPPDLAQYRTASNQFFALKRIEPTLQEVEAGKDYNPATLAKAMQKWETYPNSPRLLTDLKELGDIGAMVRKPKAASAQPPGMLQSLLQKYGPLGALGGGGAAVAGYSPSEFLTPFGGYAAAAAGALGSAKQADAIARTRWSQAPSVMRGLLSTGIPAMRAYPTTPLVGAVQAIPGLPFLQGNPQP